MAMLGDLQEFSLADLLHLMEKGKKRANCRFGHLLAFIEFGCIRGEWWRPCLPKKSIGWRACWCA